MDLRTYRSKTMAGALAEVKKDLGPDAVILRTRSYKAGGVLGFGGNSIVEITAASEAHAGPVYTPKARKAGSAVGGESPKPGAPLPARPVRVEAPTPEPAAAPATPRAEAGKGGVDLETQVSAAADRAERRVAPSTRVEFRPVSDGAQATLESELASIRRLVGQVLQTTRRTAVRVDGVGSLSFVAEGRPDPLFDLYNRLHEQETPGPFADSLVAGVRDELTTAELADRSIVRETLLRLLAARFRTAAPIEQGGRVVETLIGPTGVGKTTTIAKLAATHKLRYGRSVGLITADTYRIAAVEQLRTYAGIIGLPLEVALTPEDVASARDRLSHCDVVLIDTPGRSPRDRARLGELEALLLAAGSTRTHLVLSAGSSPGVLAEAAKRFAGTEPGCLILSKLDEASGFGVICAAAEITGLPMSYITTGQEVPDHIEPARAERLARLVLDGELRS